MTIRLPALYDKLTAKQKWKVREKYCREQGWLCYHCNRDLHGQAPWEIQKKSITKELFPPNFFEHPIHLHHDHISGLTLGAVHCYCNAVLWEYHGE